jgi:hypothetical protein
MQEVIEQANIPASDLSYVRLEINRSINVLGGRPSDAARNVVAEYKADPKRFVARFIAIRQDEKATGRDIFGSALGGAS